MYTLNGEHVDGIIALTELILYREQVLGKNIHIFVVSESDEFYGLVNLNKLKYMEQFKANEN